MSPEMLRQVLALQELAEQGRVQVHLLRCGYFLSKNNTMLHSTDLAISESFNADIKLLNLHIDYFP